MNYICSRCGKKSDTATLKAGCECGGLWKLDYKPPKFDLDKVDQREWSLFRYRAFMPPEGEVWRDITLGEGMTPVTRFNDDILLKMDYEMPTLSFKDRGAAVLISCRIQAVTRETASPPTPPERASPARYSFQRAPRRKRSR